MNKLHAGIAAALLGTGLAVAGAGTAHASYPGGDGRIAYVAYGDVYTATSTGDGAKELTRTGDAAGPRWSPDGTRIAFDRGGQVWVMNANGSGAKRYSGLTGAGEPAWSPDGKYLAVAANHLLYRVNLANGATAKFRTDLSRGEPVGVYPTATPVAWAADGRKITFESADCGNAGNYENCLDTITLTDPTSVQGTESIDHAYGGSNNPVPGRGYHPDWKPDSSAYLYSELNCPGPGGLVQQCDPVQLVLPGGTTIVGAFDGAYSPRGTRIVYVRQDSRPVLFVANADGSGEAPIVVNGSQPDWQPTH